MGVYNTVKLHHNLAIPDIQQMIEILEKKFLYQLKLELMDINRSSMHIKDKNVKPKDRKIRTIRIKTILLKNTRPTIQTNSR